MEPPPRGTYSVAVAAAFSGGVPLRLRTVVGDRLAVDDAIFWCNFGFPCEALTELQARAMELISTSEQHIFMVCFCATE